MEARGFALFDTAIGPCAVAWGTRGIVATALPEGEANAMRGRLVYRYPEAREGLPPPGVALAISDISELLSGTPNDLSRIALDMDHLPEFDRTVYAITRTIRPGATATYGEIASRMNTPGAARAVGAALGRNPFPIVVPCHRVLAANGRPGGFSARGGVALKLRLLTIERAKIATAPTLFDAHGGLPLATH
jgi:methylated-DNA-[protein]-cysteine S-methyltransferase